MIFLIIFAVTNFCEFDIKNAETDFIQLNLPENVPGIGIGGEEFFSPNGGIYFSKINWKGAKDINPYFRDMFR